MTSFTWKLSQFSENKGNISLRSSWKVPCVHAQFSTKVADLPRKACLAADYIAILRIVESLFARSLLPARSNFVGRTRFEEDISCDSPLHSSYRITYVSI